MIEKEEVMQGVDVVAVVVVVDFENFATIFGRRPQKVTCGAPKKTQRTKNEQLRHG
jgi:hypothetical protein